MRPTLLALALALLAVPAAAASWGQTRGGPGHAGVLGIDGGGTGSLRWDGDKIPGFQGSIVYSPTGEFEANPDRVLDLAWSEPTADVIAMVLWMGDEGAVDEARVLAFAGDDGRLRWSTPVAATAADREAQGPLVDGDLVVVPLGERLALLDAATGEARGAIELPGATGHVSVQDGVVYAVQGGALTAHAFDGRLLWQASWPGETPVAKQSGPLVLANGTIAVATALGCEGCGHSGFRDPAQAGAWMRFVDANGTKLDARLQWQRDPRHAASYDEGSGRAAAFTDWLEVRGPWAPPCRDPPDCTDQCFEGPLDADVYQVPSQYGPPAVAGATVVTWDYDVHVVDLATVRHLCDQINPGAGSPSIHDEVGVKVTEHGASSSNPPALGQAAAYVPDSFNGLIAVTIPDGAPLWRLGLVLGLASPLIVVDGTLYAFDVDGTLLALDAGAGATGPVAFEPGRPSPCFCQLGLERRPGAPHDLIVRLDNNGWAPGTATITLRIDGKATDSMDLALIAKGHGDVIFEDLNVGRGDLVEACVAGVCAPAVWDEEDDGADEDDFVSGGKGGGGQVWDIPAPAFVALVAALALALARRQRL